MRTIFALVRCREGYRRKGTEEEERGEERNYARGEKGKKEAG